MYLRYCSYTFISLIFFLCLVGCDRRKQKEELPIGYQTGGAEKPIDKPALVLGEGLSMLRSGDVVLRSGIGPDSYILSRFNKRDKTYSHCGIVMIENGHPFVYHSIGGEDNPDERLRRDSAEIFFTPRYCRGVAIVRYDYDSLHINRLRDIVHDYFAIRPRFDMKFDLETDSTLYCAEFVYKALNKAMNDTGYIQTSVGMGRRYVGVDDLFINPHCRIVWKVAY